MIFKMNQDRLYNYTMIFIFLTLLLPILSYYLAFFFFFFKWMILFDDVNTSFAFC